MSQNAIHITGVTENQVNPRRQDTSPDPAEKANAQAARAHIDYSAVRGPADQSPAENIRAHLTGKGSLINLSG